MAGAASASAAAAASAPQAAAVTPRAHLDASATPGAGALATYGLFGAPLALAALPLYVQLPAHWSAQLQAPLAGLGLVLLACRATDAFVDPWLGRWADGLLQGARGPALRRWVPALLLLVAGLGALFLLPAAWVTDWSTGTRLAWCAAGVLAASLGYSALAIAHQAWGLRLGGGAASQARWAAAREGAALAGVVGGSVLPVAIGMPATLAVWLPLLLLGVALLAWRAPWPAAVVGGTGPSTAAMVGAAAPAAASAGPAAPSRGALADGEAGAAVSSWRPWRRADFRALYAVHVLNGVAAAVPATLLLFYVRDGLQLGPVWEAGLLGLYFLAAAAGLPLWVALVRRHGARRAWAAGMLLALLAFALVPWLPVGAGPAFALVCALSGLALGADLVAPPVLLERLLHTGDGAERQHAALYCGWWAAAAKLNLALAAGLALPLLQWAGYAPGVRTAAAVQALVWSYAGLPWLLKLLALGVLLRAGRRHPGLRDRALAAQAMDARQSPPGAASAITHRSVGHPPPGQPGVHR
ncbi:MAG: hypothetical protein RLY78_2986 [Pseudomonadota bacterium]